MKFKIFDWAGNDLTYHHGEFESFEDAEEALCIFLADKYETDRDEYVIDKTKSRESRYLDPKDPRAGQKAAI